MIVTPELQGRFNSAFARIMSKADPLLQKKWNGKIDWKDMRSFPEISHEVIQGLAPESKAAYITLLNKLSRGSL